MKNTDVKQHISALWIVVMLNLIFADVLSYYAGTNRQKPHQHNR